MRQGGYRCWIVLPMAAFLGLHPGSAAGDPVRWGPRTQPHHAVWIRLLALGGQSWLSVRTEFRRDQPTCLRIARSDDRCRSWGDLATLEAGGRNLDNGLLFRAAAEAPILLACRSVAVERSSGRLVVFRSTDEGNTWTPHGQIDASEVAPGEIFGRGLWEPWIYSLKDGRLAAAYATEKHAREDPPFSQMCALRVSDDGGRSWGVERVLAAEPGGGALRPGMPVVTLLRDGRFLAVHEVVGIGDAQVFAKHSDDGMTWPPGLGTPIPGHRAGPFVLALEDGRLLVTSCSNRLSWSEDGGATWRLAGDRAWMPEREPDRTWLTWPALFDLGGGEVVLTTSGIGRRPCELRFGEVARP